MDDVDLAVLGRKIIDTSLYMVLGTADDRGAPWASPVYYAFEDYQRFYWVSAPDARHSHNISTRPGIGIVVFDSHALIGTGRGVYMSAVAAEITGAEREEPIAVFSRRNLLHGGAPWRLEDVEAPQRLRLYGATVREQYVSAAGDTRAKVLL